MIISGEEVGMPWQEATKVSLRLEFVLSALEEGANVRALCREYRISPTTGYKWLGRYLDQGQRGLQDRSRRPLSSPHRTPATLERKVLEIRDRHGWGGRKIERVLEGQGEKDVPPPSTITEILRRHQRLSPEESAKHRPWQRFEAEAPNELWQMDFKGHFEMADGTRCHPLTVLDDHSRFCLGLRACGDERRSTVKGQLTSIFRCYGLPECLLTDNGAPWGNPEHRRRLTRLGVWLLQLGLTLSRSGYYHPETIGKDERFHRTLSDEILARQVIHNLAHAQTCFDPWREIYNQVRPHEALGMAVPASRYQPSPRPFPETLPPVVYPSGDIVRKVDDHGKISYGARCFHVGKALHGQPVGLRPTDTDGVLDVYFCRHRVERIDLREYSQSR
jgi:transposase InsO family protein